MRHKKKKKRIKAHRVGHRKAIIRSLLISLFTHQRIKITVARAKEIRRLADRLISLAKQPTVHRQRQAIKTLQDRSLVKKLFTEIGPKFEHRQGGYTRLIRISPRAGDKAEMAILELTELIASKPAKLKKEEQVDKKPLLKKETKPEKEVKPKEKAKPKVKKPEGFLRGLRKYFRHESG
ncbi:MAG: 50S ribosomal protein L17 [Candidatus Omnitrophota bacterium]|nr:50S ribosomal protein L17 [Candidatus Omnitrophota bacterium]